MYLILSLDLKMKIGLEFMKIGSLGIHNVQK